MRCWPFTTSQPNTRITCGPSNPIESVFATLRHRSVWSKGALSQKTAKLMVFTLLRAVSKKWRKLNGRNQLPRLIEGVRIFHS